RPEAKTRRSRAWPKAGPCSRRPPPRASARHRPPAQQSIQSETARSSSAKSPEERRSSGENSLRSVAQPGDPELEVGHGDPLVRRVDERRGDLRRQLARGGEE